MILYIESLSKNSYEDGHEDDCEVGCEVGCRVSCKVTYYYIKTIVVMFEIIAYYFLACWEPWSRHCG